jgi:hypothetical protein
MIYPRGTFQDRTLIVFQDFPLLFEVLSFSNSSEHLSLSLMLMIITRQAALQT